MKLLLIISLAAAVFLAKTEAKPADINDAGVEIQKQRLIKFPDDLDNLPFDSSTTTGKDEEAKRILQEIARINQALGYVKKQSEPVKLPPMLDSSQYLFPKPAYHPFHAQKHQFAGSNGATLLVPSIRSLSTEHNRGQQLVRPEIRPASKTQNQLQLSQLQQNRAQEPNSFGPTQYYFRPNEAYRPESESARLDEHYAIPVRLYKLNKEDYLRKHAPQEYRIKGYKIIGDVAHFNSKIKSKDHAKKTTPKYQLFFLPRELALKQEQMSNLAVTIEPLNTSTTTTEMPQESNSSREEKFTLPRPFKNQLSPSTGTNGNVGIATNSSTTTTQIIRKRIIPKPSKQKEPNVQPVVLQQKPHHVGDGHTTLSKIRITPPPPTVAAQTNNENQQLLESSANQVQVPSNIENSHHHNNGTGTNAIKTAFQNIFKFPFRHQPQPAAVATERPLELQTVPLQQQPTKTVFAAHPFFSQSFLPQNFLPQNTLPQAIYNNQQQNNDYNWDDEDASNSAPSELEDDDESTEQQEEKHIFAHAHKHQQQTQKEAFRQGGIIIQRLKVRKGGIAIAGPGGVATAGSGGTAIVGPGGYALTHPRSLTIAGPGAKVIAIPSSVDLKDALERTDLSTQSFPREGRIVATGPTVYYSPATVNFAHRSNEPIIIEEQSLPFYGGLKGQYLKVQKQGDGSVNTYVVSKATPNGADDKAANAGIKAANTNSKSSPTGNHKSYQDDFNKIQLAAAQLVTIQEMAKRKGSFSAEDNKVYANSLLELGHAAQNLAKLQQTGKIKDFGLLLQLDSSKPQKQQWIREEEYVEQSGEQKEDEATEQNFSEQELLPISTEDPYEDVSDSVAVSPPKKDASVAEAKPVGLSIAGEGGVASSKPNAVALSGRNGLAVASPKATAIAGVSPEEAAAYSISLPSRDHLVIKSALPMRQRAPYEDYDYNESAVLRTALTRETPLRGIPAVRVVALKSDSDIVDPSDFISQWKLSIAEDATSPIVSSRSANKDIQKFSKADNKVALRSRDGQSFYVF